MALVVTNELANDGRDVVAPLELQGCGNLVQNIGATEHYVRLNQSPDDGFNVTRSRWKLPHRLRDVFQVVLSGRESGKLRRKAPSISAGPCDLA